MPKKMPLLAYITIFCCIFLTLCQVWAYGMNKNQMVYGSFEDTYQETKSLPKRLKVILIWTQRDCAPFNFFEDGAISFLKNNCSVNNCYITADRHFFGHDLTLFDAIAFNGRNIDDEDHPPIRSLDQKYIFFNMESSDQFPVCDPKYDGFFNLTATYKLNSDIKLPYFLVKDRDGKIIGPKNKVRWEKNMAEVDDEFKRRVQNKTKAAAWFVSNCKSRNKREDFVRKLDAALEPYGHSIDVYGKCGPFECPRKNFRACDLILKTNYFFYMSLENSFCEDYVTEKLFTALQNDIVPIVYGGADYSKFLPPGSYIDGRNQSVAELAATMDHLMHHPEEYLQFFKWKQYYTYTVPLRKENVCGLCEALNNEGLMQRSTVYKNFRAWWNPDYKNRC